MFCRPILLLTLVCSTVTVQALPRSQAARAEFVNANPCPTTGKTRGACPGYVVDHIVPLCAGGLDHHTNMQWQTVEDAKVKDRDELKQCMKRRQAAKG